MAGHAVEQSRPLLLDDDTQSQDSFDYVSQQSTAARRKRILLKLLALARPAHMTTVCKRFGYALVPGPVRSYVWDDHAPKPKQFATSYLNGLRGITAVKVMTFHFFMAFTDFTHVPYAADERHESIWIFPVFRYFWTCFSSQMFFGIAGYLTCLRLFQLLDKNDVGSQVKVFSTIAASLFRRSFRLYLPVGGMMLLVSVLIHYGFYERNRAFIANYDNFPGPWVEPKPDMKETWVEQLQIWKQEMFWMMNVSDPGTVYPHHDQHLWSILAEMRASLHLYLSMMMIAGCKRWVRVVVLCVLTWVFFIWNRWETWVYTLGALVAQIDIILTERQKEAEQPNLPVIETEKVEEKKAELGVHSPTLPQVNFNSEMLVSTGRHLHWGGQTIFRYACFFLAFYFLSFPIHGPIRLTPGYETLKYYIPEWVDRKDKVYPNIGTGIFLFLLARSDPKVSKWRRIASSSVAQYLGTISFAMYLVHGPIMHFVTYMVPHYIWWAMGVNWRETTNTAWLCPIVVGWAATLLCSWWAADVWAREVEGRCACLVKALEGVCFKAKAA